MEAQNVYDEIRKKYENYEHNDEKALRFVQLYIDRTKQDRNYPELVQGYEDAVFYTHNQDLKLKYVDSCIITSLKTEDNDLISRSYLGKGTIYYFNFKRYKPALDEYVKAFEYSKKGNDEYQKYKVIYHMGVVKSYLGYYKEALGHFKECIAYFEPNTKGDLHPNVIYNNSKGYLNSLHQSIVCYRNLGDFKKADSLIQVGLNFTTKNKDFPLENSYFTKEKGILDYHKKDFDNAIANLNYALPVLMKNDDFAWTSVSDFYIGKSYLELGQKENAIKEFEKVDSIFQKHQFITPEIRQNYELLIYYWKEKNNTQQELRYTNSLLKTDSILAKDFTYLSSKVHKDYDSRILEDAKERLEKHNYWSVSAILLLAILVLILIFISYKYYRREKDIKSKYGILEGKLLYQHTIPRASYENISTQGKSIINEGIFIELEEKLKKFEDSKDFLESGMTLQLLAENLDTNTTYLSQYINDVKGTNFNKYLSSLRINYITKLMFSNPKMLKYSVQALADECGIASRQNFSDLFLEINRIRPTDFLKQRKRELENLNSALPLVG